MPLPAGELKINEAHQGLGLGRQPFLAFLELLYFFECNLDILLLDKILDGSKGTELIQILRIEMNRRGL